MTPEEVESDDQTAAGSTAFTQAPAAGVFEIAPPSRDEVQEAQARTDRVRMALLGVNQRAHLTPASHGVWSQHEGQREWKLKIRSPGAQFVAVVLGDFKISPSAVLHVEDKSGQRQSAYTEADRNSYGGLYIPPVSGDELTLVLRDISGSVPAASEAELTVSLITHGLFDPAAALGMAPRSGPGLGQVEDLTNTPAETFGLGPSCGPDVQCAPYNVSPWSTVRRGVVYIAVNFTDFSGGSGGLVNNTDNDCTPYVLTAKHVTPDQISPTNATFYYNYQQVNCTTTTPTNQKRQGSVVRASHTGTDFALLEMDDPPDGTPDVRFNGWSRSTTAPAGAATIHHPNNLPAEIAVDEDNLTASGTGSWAWRAAIYEDGATFNGSSGANLFNGTGRVVGQLHGGNTNSTCVANFSINDDFGRFDKSWTGGGTSSTRLKDWLDPTNTDSASIGGVDSQFPLACSGLGGLTMEDLESASADGAPFLLPGEDGVISATIAYAGDPNDQVDAVSVTLNPATGLGIPEPHQMTQSKLGPGEKLKVDFAVSVSADAKCGDVVKLVFDLGGELGQPPTDTDWDGGWHPEREIRIGQKQVTTLPGSQLVPFAEWSADPSWHLNAGFPEGTAGATMLVSDQTEASLTTPEFKVERDTTVEFEHRFDTENFFDGGVFEYQIAGGEWQSGVDLITSGGYTSTIWGKASSSLAGMDSWSGDSSGWRKVVVDLAALAGADVRLRWRFVSDDQSPHEATWDLRGLTVRQTRYVCEQQ